MIADRLEPIQLMTMLIAIIGFAAIALLVRRCPDQQGWYIFGMSFLAHLIIYYLVLTIDRTYTLPVDMHYTDWSAWLRLHSAVAFVTTLIGLLLSHRSIRRINDTDRNC